MSYCGSCGTKRIEEDRFCGNCGAELETTEQEITETPEPAVPKVSETAPEAPKVSEAEPAQETHKSQAVEVPKNNPKRKHMIAIAAVLVVAIATFAFFQLTSSEVPGEVNGNAHEYRNDEGSVGAGDLQPPIINNNDEPYEPIDEDEDEDMLDKFHRALYAYRAHLLRISNSGQEPLTPTYVQNAYVRLVDFDNSGVPQMIVVMEPQFQVAGGIAMLHVFNYTDQLELIYNGQMWSSAAFEFYALADGIDGRRNLVNILVNEGGMPFEMRNLSLQGNTFQQDGDTITGNPQELVFDATGHVLPGVESLWRYPLSNIFGMITEIDRVLLATEIRSNISIYADDGFIIPFSSARRLTADDIVIFSREKLRIARNEIFARHGRRFNDAQLQAHFDAMPWYTPTLPLGTEPVLSDIERENVELIRSFEN